MNAKTLLALLLLLTIPLCSSAGWFKRNKKPEPEPAKASHITTADLPAGYALLFDLLSDEKNVSKLLLVKKERDPLDKLINDIADTAKDAHKQLEKLGKSAQFNLKDLQLPALESATRESIAREKAKHLLKSKGAEFEFYLLNTQHQALTYGLHLVRSLAAADSDPARQKFLSQIAARFEELRDRTSDLILTHRKAP